MIETVVGAVGIVVTTIGIIVTVISIVQTSQKRKTLKKQPPPPKVQVAFLEL